jgi:hypothetical protein
MHIQIPDDVRNAAIAANLQALNQLLTEAAKRVSEGYEVMQQGNRNGAIGAVLDLDKLLEDAKSLYGAARVLHLLGPA